MLLNLTPETDPTAIEKLRLDDELRAWSKELLQLARNHTNDGDVATRQLKDNERSRPATFAKARTQRLHVLRHYVNAYASQYAHDKLEELGEPRYFGGPWARR
jgi:hypothetical protein